MKPCSDCLKTHKISNTSHRSTVLHRLLEQAMKTSEGACLRTGFDSNEIGLLQLVARNWVSAILRNILQDQPPLIDMARLLGDNRVLRRFARDRAKERHAESKFQQFNVAGGASKKRVWCCWWWLFAFEAITLGRSRLQRCRTSSDSSSRLLTFSTSPLKMAPSSRTTRRVSRSQVRVVARFHPLVRPPTVHWR